MGWRTVVVSKRCKLEYKLGYLVCRGEQLKKVFLNEISTLIVESTAVSLTTALLCELTKRKINVVFCDDKHNPQSQLLSLYDRHDCSGILKKQLAWREDVKKSVWAEIVRQKIKKQADMLRLENLPQFELLQKYASELVSGDLTNREGHAAKVYFDALFGLSFRRGDKTFINGALNYGYAILLSAFNREIVGCGYSTMLGLAHKNEFNQFNLSCDLMEPFRPLVDKIVIAGESSELSSDYKHYLCNILNLQVEINRESRSISDAIGIYIRSVFEALETGNVSAIKCYEF